MGWSNNNGRKVFTKNGVEIAEQMSLFGEETVTCFYCDNGFACDCDQARKEDGLDY